MSPPPPSKSAVSDSERGFTLIELSIVLVIIGLIVGGVLVGQDLIKAAAVRAQVTQIDKLNSAVNTFRGKFGYLPGDIQPQLVTQFGFTAAPTRPGDVGRGDGNGILQAVIAYNSGVPICWGFNAELAWFWEDLSTNSNLIEGSFNTAGDAPIVITGTTGFALYVPAAKIGNGNYVFVFSAMGANYFQIVVPTSVVSNSATNANIGLTVRQAYMIDQKIDDGGPVTGKVQAAISISGATSPNGTLGNGSAQNIGGFDSSSLMSAALPSTTTCYDTTSNNYSLLQNNGTGMNCALSFQFQ